MPCDTEERKKLGSHWYHLYLDFGDKQKAYRMAQILRAQGYHVRVVPYGDYRWNIYTRPKVKGGK